MTTIEDIKTELREIIELERQITPGRWSPGSESIWSHNSRVCNDAETDDMIFVCRARNLTPKMAKALLGVIERLESKAAAVEIAMHGQPERRTLHAMQADSELKTIRREWEAQA
jgi:hypothetical protein